MKKGFTLAEVLITLTIVGVVAALAVPTIVAKFAAAKIGPTLSKVVSTIENANEQILFNQEMDNLSKVAADRNEYYEILTKYIANSSYNIDTPATFSVPPRDYQKNDLSDLTEDEHLFPFKFSDDVTLFMYADEDISYEEHGGFKGPFLTMYVDINSENKEPNIVGKDIFYFWIDKSGAVIPVGNANSKWLAGDTYYYGTAESDYQCNEDGVTTGKGCAGSIFSNNKKVIY